MTDTMQSHYEREGIVERIVQGAVENGADIDTIQVGDLGSLDEFHVGRREASELLAPLLELGAGDEMLDVGCGVGGPARFFADATGAHVQAIDLTPEFIKAAVELTDLVGMSDQISFQLASGTDIPFEDDRFDATTLMHVGMNIEDKTTLLSEMARVTRDGGIVLVYDLMRIGDGDLGFPMPWAATERFSFVERREVYESAARNAGLTIIERVDFNAMARTHFDTAKHATTEMYDNAKEAVRSGVISPIALIMRS